MKNPPDSRPGFERTSSASEVNGRLIMVSNRGPVEHCTDEHGRLQRRDSAGGVATALASLDLGTPMTWIAGAATVEDQAVAANAKPIDLGDGRRLRLIAPDAGAYDLFYGTFCNPILWFLQHALWEHLAREIPEEELLHAWEQGYLPVNQAFAEAVIEELDRDDVPGRVMLHDYHLYAAPLFIRNRRPSAVLQQFIHVPWPGPETWAHLPRKIVESFCEGLLANDSVVFQTEACAENFRLTCRAYLTDVSSEAGGRTLTRGRHQTRVWHNPISVDAQELRTKLASPEAQALRANLIAEAGEHTVIRVDRIDPSKNVAAGFRAFGRLFERHPEWIGRVKFLAFLVPSRTALPEYRAYEDEVFAEITAVNGRFGRAGWTPITVFHENNRLQALVAMSLYDVLLINSVADGMNLVSKEGPMLNQREGRTVLSRSAGAFAELSDAAIGVDPSDVDATAEALHRALAMQPAERRKRAQRMRETISHHNLSRWLRLLLLDLENRAAAKEAAADQSETLAALS